jgi:hypothetical protein
MNNFKREESKFKIKLVIGILTTCLVINWLLLIICKISPIGFILFLNEKDYIKEVPTNNLANMKQGILYEFTLDNEMFEKR